MQPSIRSHKPEIHWLSAWQFALSALAIFGLWSTGFLLIVMGLMEGLSSPGSLSSALSMFLMSAGIIASGLLLVPSAAYALLRLSGRQAILPLPAIKGIFRPTLLILTLPLVLLLGHWVSQSGELAWFLLPPLHVLAVGLPVLWLLYLGGRGLPLGSSQRRWGVFGSGLVLGPALILLAELIALLGFVVLAAIAISSQPGLAEEINSLLQRLVYSRSSPESMMRALSPYLASPVILLAIFSFGAVVVPLIEELIKPIGVWFLAGKNLSPAAGFTAGLLSGAGYALFESLALSSSGEEWSFLVIARIGTAVIHILTTGMTGWALALAWRDGRYLRLALAYLAAVLIHGAWNGMTLLTIVPPLLETQGEPAGASLISRLGSTAPFGLGVLTIGGFIILLLANRTMRAQADEETQV